ncbi:MAG: transglutaminase-like domain-containing protein [Thermodesulfobacteriota bacterium]
MRPARRLLLGLVLLACTGCAGLYFQPATTPAAPARPDLAHWPYREYWCGLVFNGARIGFSHLAMAPAAEPGLYEIRSEMALAFRLLMLDKRITLKAQDLVRPDLSLVSFHYDFNLDGHTLIQDGLLEGDTLTVRVESGAGVEEERHPAPAALYPASGTYLYPLLHDLVPGRVYEFAAYHAEARTVATVRQEIFGWETSELFFGQACRIRTQALGQSVETWLDTQGRPQLELALGGVLIAGLEDEAVARRYLAEAALSKAEAFIDFSLIRTEPPIPQPRATTELEMLVTGLPATLTLPSDSTQTCTPEAAAVRCRLRRPAARPCRPASPDTWPEEARWALFPTNAAPNSHPAIQALAREVAGSETDPCRQIDRLLAWIASHIAREPVDVFSALDVLAGGKAECQGHALLFAALARALDIPCRVVNGITYSEDFAGFLYHTWTEVFLDSSWQPVDPTFGQPVADATHLKLLAGETIKELAPLVDVVGRIQVEVKGQEGRE